MSLNWDEILNPNEMVRAFLIWSLLGLSGWLVTKFAKNSMRRLLSKFSAKVNLEYSKHHYAVERFKNLSNEDKVLYLVFIRAMLWKRHRELILYGLMLLILIWSSLSQVDVPQRFGASAITLVWLVYVVYLAWKDAEYSLLYNEMLSAIGEMMPKTEFDTWYASQKMTLSKESERSDAN